MVVHMYAILNNTFTLDTSYVVVPPLQSVVLILRSRCMNNQLNILQTLFPHDVLFPKNCDLSVKPPASCVPASVLRGVHMLTLNRKTVAKVPDDGNRTSSSSASASQTNVKFTASQTGVNAAAIAGISIGSFVIGVVTFLAFLFWRHYRIAQAKLHDANPHPKAEGSSGAVTQVTHNDESIIVIENPSPAPQKVEMHQTPLTRGDQASDSHIPDEQHQQSSITS